MIIDKLCRAERYYYLNENLQKAFEFVINNDLNAFEPGSYEIDGKNSYIIIAKDQPGAEAPNKLEAHRRYIDVQMAIEGSFGLAWKALEECNNVISEYELDMDVAFFSDNADFEVLLNPGKFAILMPEDSHFAQPPKTDIKKAVLKILV